MAIGTKCLRTTSTIRLTMAPERWQNQQTIKVSNSWAHARDHPAPECAKRQTPPLPSFEDRLEAIACVAMLMQRASCWRLCTTCACSKKRSKLPC